MGVHHLLTTAAALTACRGALDAPVAPPMPSAPRAQAVLMEPADGRCEDERLGALHETDASYLVTAGELFDRQMRAHQVDVRRCVVHRRQYVADLGGKVVLVIRFDDAGHVAHVQTRGPDAELDRCLCQAVLQLPDVGLRSATVTYPLYVRY